MTDRHFGSMVMEDQGEGPVVVMIHGLGGSSNSFECQVGALEGYRVLRPDLPGAGRSAPRPGLNGLQGMAGAVREHLVALDVEQAHFAGHSMGALICQYLAVDHPDIVQSMTLFGAILEPSVQAKQMLKERAATARAEGMAGIAQQISTGSVGAPARGRNPVTQAFVRETVSRQDPNGYAAHCEALGNARAADHARITCPTLLIAGELDPVAPVAMAKALDQNIPNTTLEVLTGISHWMMIEDPDRTNDLMRAHLDKLGG